LNTEPSISVETHFFQNGRGWLIFFLAAMLQSLAALVWLASIPGDPKNSLFLGFSASRLGLMAAALLAVTCFLTAGVLTLRSRRFNQKIQSLAEIKKNQFILLCLILLIFLIAGWTTMVILRADPGEATFSIFERLRPIITLACLLSLEGLLWFMIARYGLHWSNLSQYRQAGKYSLWGVIFCVVFGVIIALTGFGIIPDEFYWGSPGVPLLAWQVAGSALLSLAAFVVFRNMKQQAGWKTDLALFILFWAGAYFLWLSQPIPRSYFTPSPRPPNFEVYPYSDAGFYDFVSQSLLTGNGFLNHKIITRPIYAVILAGFHSLVGQDYSDMIALQTVILALFPPLLYLLGKALHSREVGILTAVLAVWREMNLLAATPLTEVSNSKMLMTDSLTGVAFTALILLLIWWQNRNPGSLKAALGIGGFFGLMLLLRTQALMVLPVIVVVVLLNRRRRFKHGLLTAAVFILGAIISFSPWVIRNYQLTGQLIMDQPSQTALHALRFSLSMETVDNSLTSKPPAEVTATVARFVLEHPIFTLKFMAAHFLNNEFSTLTVLPIHLNLIDPRDNLFVKTPFWLQGLNGLSLGQILLLVFNLGLIVTGTAFSYWKFRWTGLIPLFVHLAYSASSAVARISGWRFVQPVDWVVYLYFAIGLACLFMVIIQVFGWKNIGHPADLSTIKDNDHIRAEWPWLAGLAVGFFLLGAITPAMEILIPQRYPVEDKALLFEKMLLDPSVSTNELVSTQIREMQPQENSVALWGRALYPRFYKEDAGEPGSGWMAYKANKFSKLGFVMITPSGDSQVVLPAEDAPQYFPNGSDVLLVGCKKDGWIEAAVVLVGMDKNELYLSSQSSAFNCD
jgi:hypothetical protein